MKVLIIGKNGFIASSLFELFNQNLKFTTTQTSSSELNFLNSNQVDKFMENANNKFDILIFTPVYGGRRLQEDKSDIIDKNLIMYNNMVKHKEKFKFIFYFGSGASFNRDIDINNFNNNELGNSIPTDPYGFSKYQNEIDIRNHDNIINLRIFNCFGIKESHDRMIKANILNYINGNDIIIHQDRYFDFIYIDDLYKIILSCIDGYQSSKEINCVYEQKLKLSDIATIINRDNKVNIKILNNEMGNSYTGKMNYNKIKNFTGLNKAILNMYQLIFDKINLVKLKENIKCIIFDFDDTLVWSEEIKKNTFLELAKEYGRVEEEYMMELRNKNKYDRYEMFELFCNKFNIQDKYDFLIDKYSKLSKKGIIKTSNLPGVVELLNYLYEHTNIKMFISSKSPKTDLDYFIKERKWDKYFNGVHGLPSNKTQHINKIKLDYNYKSNEILFIGDSIGDYNVSMKNNIYFIGIINESLENITCNKISNYDNLCKLIF